MKTYFKIIIIALGIIFIGTQCSDKKKLEFIESENFKLKQNLAQVENDNELLKLEISGYEKEIQSLNEQTKYLGEKISKMNKTASKSSKEKRKAEWNQQIDQILIKLERVLEEDNQFWSLKSEREFSNEESRLKSLCREQESQARSIVLKIENQEFPGADELDGIVQGFANSYSLYIGYLKMSVMYIGLELDSTKDIEKTRNEFLSETYDKLLKIRLMKLP